MGGLQEGHVLLAGRQGVPHDAAAAPSATAPAARACGAASPSATAPAARACGATAPAARARGAAPAACASGAGPATASSCGPASASPAVRAVRLRGWVFELGSRVVCGQEGVVLLQQAHGLRGDDAAASTAFRAV